MTIERLLEAVMRLAKASGHPFGNVLIEVDDKHYAVGVGNARNPTAKETFRRNSTISVTAAQSGWQVVGTASIDINGIVLGLDYKTEAAWWMVNPFIEAMEGK